MIYETFQALNEEIFNNSIIYSNIMPENNILNNEINNLKEENSDLKLHLQNSVKDLEDLQMEIVSLTDQIQTKKQQIENFKTEYKRLEEKKNEIIKKYELELDELKKKKNHENDNENIENIKIIKDLKDNELLIKQKIQLNLNENEQFKNIIKEMKEKELEYFKKIDLIQKKYQEITKKNDCDQIEIVKLQKQNENLNFQIKNLLNQLENDKKNNNEKFKKVQNMIRKFRITFLQKILKEIFNFKLCATSIKENLKIYVSSLISIATENCLTIQNYYSMNNVKMKQNYEKILFFNEENYLKEKKKYKNKIKKYKKELDLANDFKYNSYIEVQKEQKSIFNTHNVPDLSFLKNEDDQNKYYEKTPINQNRFPEKS